MSTTPPASQVTMMHPDYGLEDPRVTIINSNSNNNGNSGVLSRLLRLLRP